MLSDARARSPAPRLPRTRHRYRAAPHPRAAARCCPTCCAGARGAARPVEAGFDGVELHYRPRLHHGLVPVAAERPRRRLRRLAGKPRPPAARGDNRPVRDTVGDDFVVGCRYLSRGLSRGRLARSTTRPISASTFARAGMDFPVAVARRQASRTRQAAGKTGDAAYPYTGPSGYECMPQFISDARGPFGRNVEPAADQPYRTAVRAADLRDTPVVVTGGIHGFPPGRRYPARRRQADIIGLGAAKSGRSRIGSLKVRPRPWRRAVQGLRIHQLLRGARSEACAGDLQVVGPHR